MGKYVDKDDVLRGLFRLGGSGKAIAVLFIVLGIGGISAGSGYGWLGLLIGVAMIAAHIIAGQATEKPNQ